MENIEGLSMVLHLTNPARLDNEDTNIATESYILACNAI